MRALLHKAAVEAREGHDLARAAEPVAAHMGLSAEEDPVAGHVLQLLTD